MWIVPAAIVGAIAGCACAELVFQLGCWAVVKIMDWRERA